MTQENQTNSKELITSFMTLKNLLQRHFEVLRRQRGPFGNPHRGQGRVLALLKLQPKISQKELAFLLDMRPQSLGELLTKLENSGYVSRETSTEDRRVMIVKLTEAGEQVAKEIDQDEPTESVFDHLSSEEQRQFQGIMTKLIGQLEKEVPTDSPRGFGRPNGRDPRPDFSDHPHFRETFFDRSQREALSSYNYWQPED